MRKSLFILLAQLLLLTSVHGDPIPSEKLYLNSPIREISLSPDGRWLSAYIMDTPETGALNLISKENISIPILKTNRSYKITSHHWIDNNHIYVAYKTKDGKHKKGILDIDSSKRTPKVKFSNISAKGYLLDPLKDKEDTLLFAKLKKQRLEVYKSSIEDLKKGKPTKKGKLKIYLEGSIFYTYYFSKKQFLSVKYDEDTEKLSLWSLPQGEDEWTEIYSWSDEEFYFRPEGILSNNNLLILTDMISDKVSAVEFDVSTKEIKQVFYEHPKYDLVDAGVSPVDDHLEWVSFYNHGKLEKKYFSNKEDLLSKKLKRAFNGKQISTIANNRNNSRVIKAYSSNDPGTIYWLDEESNTALSIDAVYPSLEGIKLAKTEALAITARDGKEIEAFLTQPSSNNNKTLLVMPHGGPIDVADRDQFLPDIQYLVSRGYSVLRVNFRGSAGYGKEFKKSGVGEFGQLIEKDITDVVSEVTKSHHFEHTCSIGISYGGFSAMSLATQHPEQYDCVIAMYGVYDLPLLFNEGNRRISKHHRKSMSRIAGEYSEDLRNYSPAYVPEKIKSPVLLIAGNKDDIAVPEHTNRMKYMLEKHGADVETIFYKTAAHGHDNWRGEMHQSAYIHDFITEKLNLSKSIDTPEIDMAEDALIADSYYFNGLVKKDYKKAMEYYLRAAKNGHSRAMHHIATFYHLGFGVSKDLSKAVEWYKKSSDSGYALSSYILTNIMEHDHEDPKEQANSDAMAKLATNQQFDAQTGILFAEGYCPIATRAGQFDKCLDLLAFIDPNKNKNAQKTPDYQFILDNTFSKLIFAEVFSKNQIKTIAEKIDPKINMDTVYKNTGQLISIRREAKSKES